MRAMARTVFRRVMAPERCLVVGEVGTAERLARALTVVSHGSRVGVRGPLGGTGLPGWGRRCFGTDGTRAAPPGSAGVLTHRLRVGLDQLRQVLEERSLAMDEVPGRCLGAR